jgi:hypothetical protein
MASSVSFDITEKTVDFAYQNIKDMPGNNGQQVLVDRIPKDDHLGKVIVTVTIPDDPSESEEFNIEVESNLELRSNHPEAIEIILGVGQENIEMFADRASIPGPWALVDAIANNNWKVVGWDQ